MRIPRLALMAGALAGVLFAGTAHAATSAAPSYKPVLTKNPLYKTGKLGISACEEPQVQNGTVEEAELYFEAVMDCLDKAWSPVVRKAGYRFSKAKLAVVTKVGAKLGNSCGTFPEGAQAVYCHPARSMYILLSPDVVEEPTDLILMQTLAHEYGHHVQNLTGIWKGTYDVYMKAGEKRILETLRRTELQAQCMSGAFIGRLWNSLGRPDTDWSILLKGGHNPVAALGARSDSDETHASDANNRVWLQKGFKAQSASGCNTFTAPASKVH